MRIVYVIDRPSWTASRLTDVLEQRGHVVDYRCPRVGDDLPPPESLDALIIGGGSSSVWHADREPFVARLIEYTSRVVESGTPFFGICFGAQVLAAAFGSSSRERTDGRAEFGFYPIEPTPAGADLFGELPVVFQSHYEGVTDLPDCATLLAGNDTFEVQAFRIGDAAYGVQFHPDARADMIDSWYADNTHLHDRPGSQSLAEHLAGATRHEASRQAWVERFVEMWAPAEVPSRSAATGAGS